VDWSLRSCARAGHATYAVTEPELRDRLHITTSQGEAWRCLRCGDYVLGEPGGDGPADQAPVLLRGKALRSAFILRLLAVERFVRGLVLLLLGVGVLQFKSRQVSVREVIEHDLSAAKPLFKQIGWNASDSGLIHTIEKALNARGSTLNLIAAFLLIYGVLQVIEGVGLWKMQRWGEYFAVIATAIFLPLEVYELTENATILKAVVLLINIAAVVYLLLSKRLFGLRGGHAAYTAELHEESLLEVEESSDGGNESSPDRGSLPDIDSGAQPQQHVDDRGATAT
jgi:uncharacterized membrane protein (DUF2068 family)